MAMQPYEAQRRRRMPDIIEATERKLAGLYREARRYSRAQLVNKELERVLEQRHG